MTRTLDGIDLALLASRSVALGLGITVFLLTTYSLMKTLVVPRPTRSLISDTTMAIVVAVTNGLARMARTYKRRDSILAWTGPVIIVSLLIAWLLGYLIAYTLMVYGISRQTLPSALEQSGSSLFTLGFSAGKSEDQTFVDFVAAATGPIVIGLLIGFLPTLYQTYLDREVEVTMLSTPAGEPAWGPELLSRAALTGRIGDLPDLYERWDRWAANLRLTHTAYPILLRVRSQRATRHYLVSLLAILDSAALRVALRQTASDEPEFRVLLVGSQAFHELNGYGFAGLRGPWRRPRVPTEEWVLPEWDEQRLAVHRAIERDSARGMSVVGHIKPAADPQSLALSRAEFDVAVRQLQVSGYPMDRDADAAWTIFARARALYEQPAYAMLAALNATPAPWSGPRFPATPVIWPHRAIEELDEHESLGEPQDVSPQGASPVDRDASPVDRDASPSEASPDASSTLPGPDAHPR